MAALLTIHSYRRYTPGMRTLITGGVKSGKSSKAVQLALESFAEPRYFVATAEPFDKEMRARIDAHKEHRADRFTTIEEPVHIDHAVQEHMILDCVTMWVNNILYYEKEHEWPEILDRFLAGLGEHVIIVTNETGLGNIPSDGYARRYNRLLGEANIRIANRVDRVLLMVSGYPIVVK